MTIKPFVIGIFLGCLVLGNLSCSSDDVPELGVVDFPGRTGDFSLWQLEPFYGEVQMAYILRTDDQKVIVVDGGPEISAPILEGYIKQLGGTVDTWVLTHPHQDHIGAFISILKNGNVLINRIIHAKLDLDWVDLNESQTLALVKQYNESLENKAHIQIIDALVGDVYRLGDRVTMTVIGARNEEIRYNAINNSSLSFKLQSPNKSVLFLGDLGVEGGNKILRNSAPGDISADYVQMAHHGQSGVDKEFYEAVNAKYALWPTPEWLWENNLEAKGPNTGTWRTLTVRQWMDDLGILKNYVSGLQGTVQID